MWEPFTTWAVRNAGRYQLISIPIERTDVHHEDEPLRPYRSYFRLWLAGLFLSGSSEQFPERLTAVFASVRLPFDETGSESVSFSRVRLLEEPQTLAYDLNGLMPYNGGQIWVEAALLSLKADAAAGLALNELSTFSSEGVAASGFSEEASERVSRRMSELYNACGGEIHLGLRMALNAGGVESGELRPGYFAVISATAEQVAPGHVSVRENRLYYSDAEGGEPRPLGGCDYLLLYLDGAEGREEWRLGRVQQWLTKAGDAIARRARGEAELCRRIALLNVLSAPSLTVYDRRRAVVMIQDELKALEEQGLGAVDTSRLELENIFARRGPAMSVTRAARMGPLGFDEFVREYMSPAAQLQPGGSDDLPELPEVRGMRKILVSAGDADVFEGMLKTGEGLRPAPAYKSVNAWLDEREGEPQKPLRAGETYTLNLAVGKVRGHNLFKMAHALIAETDIPEKGLETAWFVASRSVEIKASSNEITTTAEQKGEDTFWTARFSLHIPRQGESEVRRLSVKPVRQSEVSLDVLIFVGDTLYRQLAIEFNVEQEDAAVPAAPRDAVEVGESVSAPAGELRLRTLRESWTPPGTLHISVIKTGDALVSGTAGALGDLGLGMETRWYASAQKLGGLITNLREAVNTFRSKWQRYLNAVEPDDLAQRLTSGRYQNDVADAAHEKLWEEVEASDELYYLARAGYRLYQTVFPEDTELRAWVDALDVGWRLNIFWPDLVGPLWVPHVPWGLMYRREPKAGEKPDPFNFLGLRLRIGYTAHGVRSPRSKALGAASRVHRANLLYWGTQQNDEVTAESVWQQGEWNKWGNLVFVPDAQPPAAAKRAALDLLDAPSPRPMPVLYLFCKCEVGDGNEVVLRFGSGKQPEDLILGKEIGLTQLPDQPLVFINACVSSAATAYIANDLEQIFFDRGCRAYLGTETYVPIQLASRFASIFYHHFYRVLDPRPISAGEAVYQSRVFLWRHYRNIGGLLYTYVNQYELFMAEESELKSISI